MAGAGASRYARQLVLPQVGPEGQARLRAARVLVVGAGGLGCPVLQYLAAAGVGQIGIVDGDRVEATNLHRQVLYGVGDVGALKAQAAAAALARLNPDIHVEAFPVRLTSANALPLVQQYDVIVDASDNFPTRYLVSDACVLAGKPDVYASALAMEGQASVFWAARGPCYRCLHPRPPPPHLVPNCEQAGVLGVVPGLVGLVQATEVLKLLLGAGTSLVGRLVLLDAQDMQWVEVRLRKDPACAACGPSPTVTKLIDYEAFCGTRMGAAEGLQVSPIEVKRMMDAKEDFVLLDVRQPEEAEIARIEGSVLIPTTDLQARVGELDPQKEVVVYCHHGSRSALVTHFLRRQGFRKVRNLQGGIVAWSEQVDPSVPTY
jgi:sulfur-carrier protein adenylyltransferase/sulfurtransferase